MSTNEQIDGQLFRYESSQCHRHAFITNPEKSKNVIILIPGLTEGIFSMKWTSKLSQLAAEKDHALVMVNLSSSFLQFGLHPLSSDADELLMLVTALSQLYRTQRLVLVGHSTGCQIIATFLRVYATAVKDSNVSISAVVMHSGVSDREVNTIPDIEKMTAEATDLIKENKASFLLSKKFFDAPISAARFLSLTAKLGADDMFSTDLTEEELIPIFSGFEFCPKVLFLYGSEDEFVPSVERLDAFAQTIMAPVLRRYGCDVQIEWICGDHSSSSPESQAALISWIEGLLTSLK